MAFRCTASAATWAGPRRRCLWRALPRPRARGARPACAVGCSPWWCWPSWSGTAMRWTTARAPGCTRPRAGQPMYGLPLSITAMVVTGYMLCGAVGMLIGGFLVGRVQRLEKIISVCLLGSAALLVVVGLGFLSRMAGGAGGFG